MLNADLPPRPNVILMDIYPDEQMPIIFVQKHPKGQVCEAEIKWVKAKGFNDAHYQVVMHCRKETK